MNHQLILSSLTLEGFGPYVQRQTIKFPAKGAILITGHWRGTDMSSGCGKSKILQAIAFALGYCSKPATRLKSWYSKKFYVCLVLTDGTMEYTVTRDPKLKFHNGIKEWEGTAAEEQLAGLLKTNPDLARLLTYRVQRTGGSFLNATDSENKENLSQVLNFKEIERAYDQINKTLSDLTTQKTSLEGELSGITGMLDTGSVTQQEIDRAKQEYEAAIVRVNQLTSNSQEKEQLASRLEKLSDYMRKIAMARRDQARSEQENQQLKSRALTLKNDIEKLKQAKCHACLRDWDDYGAALDAKQTDLVNTVKRYEENLSVIKNFQPIIDAEQKVQAQMAEIHGKIASMDAPLADASRALGSAKTTLKTLADRVEAKKKVEARQSQLTIQVDELTRKISLNRHAANLLGRGGFQSVIFDEVLREIQTRANEMITYIPNISMYTLKIASKSVTQAGKVNSTINSRIYRDGRETEVDDSSGGQACGLELCTDLSYAEAVRKRCSSPLGWVCLDEAMNGLDVAPKRAALEVIKSKVGGQIIVIEHATEVKEGFESVIEVEYDGRESRIVSS